MVYMETTHLAILLDSVTAHKAARIINAVTTSIALSRMPTSVGKATRFSYLSFNGCAREDLEHIVDLVLAAGAMDVRVYNDTREVWFQV